jgi:hypothetical protein
MKLIKSSIWIVPLFIMIAIVFGFFVSYLWNMIMPQIFNLPSITYMQAIGLVILCKILFGNFETERTILKKEH